jgi:hypothetical protein
MDLENQKRIKEFADKFGAENMVMLSGAAEAEAAGLAAETVILGDPTYSGALSDANLGICAYHVVEPEFKAIADPAAYEEQIGMAELTLDVAAISEEMQKMRAQCKCNQ